VELPPKYYHENFEYLLSFVRDKYADILLASEWQFLRKYYSLPEDAQCLFIRFANRKGVFFCEDKVKYGEIDSIPEQLALLKERGFVSALLYPTHEYWSNELLATLTKAELYSSFPLLELKHAKKEELIDYIKANFTVEELISAVKGKWVKVNFEEEVSFLKFLFFGNRTMDMTEFVIRDLGLVQYYKQSDDDLVARFKTRKEAEDKWRVSEQYLVFAEIKNEYAPEDIFDWYCAFRDDNRSLSAIAVPAFQKLQLLIGRHLERAKLYDLAIEVYKDAVVSPARERRVRCMAKARYFEEARALCEEMIQMPQNADELYFAEYFLPTLSGKKNKKHTTLWLKVADEISIPSMYRHQVELGSLEYFIERGYSGSFSENFSWRALFGLWFWDILFDPSLVAFHHPFQRRPSDLYLPDFYDKRKQQVEERLHAYASSDEALAFLWQNFEAYQGTANPFVVWDMEIWGMVRILVHRVPIEALRSILRIMAENLVENSRGMPDLLIWTEETYELIEIKSPNDALSHQQLFWLKTFQELGVNARVLRVRFEA
jgi:hypothetical protein